MSNGWAVAVHEVAVGCGGWADGFVKVGFAGQPDDILLDVAMDLTNPGYVHSLMAVASANEFVISHIGIECATLVRHAHNSGSTVARGQHFPLRLWSQNRESWGTPSQNYAKPHKIQ